MMANLIFMLLDIPYIKEILVLINSNYLNINF